MIFFIIIIECDLSECLFNRQVLRAKVADFASLNGVLTDNRQVQLHPSFKKICLTKPNRLIVFAFKSLQLKNICPLNPRLTPR
jgi:hypothetical protein